MSRQRSPADGNGSSGTVGLGAVVQTTQQSQLLTLNTELQAMIIANVRRREDLRSLCLTCKEFNSHAMARLYEDIRITLPLDRGLVCVLEPLIKTKANGLRFTKRLSIMCDYNQGVGYLSDADFEEFADDGGMSPFSGRYNDMVVTLNVLVRTILEKIPNDQLSSFRWCHEFPVGNTILQQLAHNQTNSLRDLQMDQLGRLHRSNILDRMSDQLAVITCLSLGLFDDMTNAHVLGQLARKHWSSLLRLELGIERNLVGQYALPAIYKVEQHKEASQQFLVGLGDLKSPSTAFNLTSLRLCGLCLDGDHLGDFATTVIANNLKTLSLESCSGSGVFLANLVRYFSSSGEVSTQETAHKTIKLRSFTLRHELPTAVMISSFEKFVDSFCGLEELFVLLDQTDKMPHPRCFLKKHGLTLKKLVWEGRTAPRQNMEHDTSIFTEQLNCSSKLGEDISSSCRSLAELGIALEWDSMNSSGLERLRRLRTLNIRNLPSRKQQDHGVISLSNFTKAAATQFIELIIGSGPYRMHDPPMITLLVLGSITYEGMRRVSRSDKPEKSSTQYLQPIFFHVDYHKDVTDKWRPLLTEVGRNSPEGIDEHSCYTRIFKPYWLR